MLQISLLGEFDVTFNETPISGLHADRPQTLLAYLLLHRSAPQPRQHLAFSLWPDSTESQARTNLRNLIFTLRQLLPEADHYLVVDPATIQWRPDSPYRLDVGEFETAVARARESWPTPAARPWLESAVTLYRGDLLPGNYDDWLMPLREKLRQNYLEALGRLITLLEEAAEYRAALAHAHALLLQDPLDESTTIQLMRLSALSGDRAGVRRAYQNCVATLQRELGIEPGRATQEAYEHYIRLEAVGVSSPLPPPPAHERPAPTFRPRPLPVPATPFIGREAELAELALLLANADCHLITILGPGGMGKTRLALESTAGHQAVFPDGVAYLSLAPVQSSALLVSTIADGVGFPLAGAAAPEEQLLNFLQPRNMLLVLDNFEHLLDGIDLLTEILNRAPAVKLLVTSRERLNIRQEWVLELQDFPPPPDEISEDWELDSAVSLFLQSARRATQSFTLTPADYPQVARICRLVGGMPLGIELAAAWVHLLSCEEIAAEIENNLDFLASSLRDLPDRHRSLRAVFDHSWRLLPPEEQEALAQLSIFHGGFTRTTAQAVVGASLPILSSLVNKSLVQRTAAGRYGLHEVIRQYAGAGLSRLPAAAAITDRHGRYFLQWLQDQDGELKSGRQKESLNEITAEMANIRAAWSWAVADRQADLLAGAANPLLYFYELRGMFREGETVFGQAADALRPPPAANGDCDRRAAQICEQMRANQAFFIYRRGGVSEATALLEASVDRLRALADPDGLRYAIRYLGMVYGMAGRWDEAQEAIRESLALARAAGQPWEIALLTGYLGHTSYDHGEFDESRRHFLEALDMGRALGDLYLLSYTLNMLSRTNLALGFYDEARQLIDESLHLSHESNDPYSAGTSLMMAGLLARKTGDPAAARDWFRRSQAVFASCGDRYHVERATLNLGYTALAAGDPVEAARLFSEAIQSAARRQNTRNVLGGLAGQAMIRARAGDALAAYRWAAWIGRHPLADLETRHRVDRLRSQLAADLTPQQQEALTAELECPPDDLELPPTDSPI